jgi:RimJ/RimL family protein N-acetyltransferase
MSQEKGTNDTVKRPEFKALHTERLVLRRFTSEDAEDFFAYRSDPEISRYQSWKPKHVDEMRRFIAGQAELAINTPDSWFQLAVCLRSGGELIGDCGLHFPLHESWQAEIGYTIASRYQRQGYARESAQALLSYLFDTLGKHRVYASVDPRNSASIAVLRRMGMRREAFFVASIQEGEGWADDAVYALLAEEYRRGDGRPRQEQTKPAAALDRSGWKDRL